MNPTVSIIIPVYNAEATLRRCVNSVLKQEYADFELLLVCRYRTGVAVGVQEAVTQFGVCRHLLVALFRFLVSVHECSQRVDVLAAYR